MPANLRITDVERIDRMMMAAEARRDAILRQLERRRATLAQSLRDAIWEAEETEFKIIPLDRSANEKLLLVRGTVPGPGTR